MHFYIHNYESTKKSIINISYLLCFVFVFLYNYVSENALLDMCYFLIFGQK